MRKKQKENKQSSLIVAIVCCIAALAVMIVALIISSPTPVGEFTPPPFDPSAKQGEPSLPPDSGWEMLDAKAYAVGVDGKLKWLDGKVDVWLTNPQSNSVWLKVRILDAEGNILGESGLTRPGEYVQSVTITQKPASDEPVTLKVMAYEPETYYSAGAVNLNTSIRSE